MGTSRSIKLCVSLALVLSLIVLLQVALAQAAPTAGKPAAVAAPAALPIVDDFESGVPANWFVYGDWGAGAAYNVSTVLTNTLSAPGLVNNTVLRVDYTVAGWGCGGGRDLAPDDWSAYDGLSLWFYGANTGRTYQIILSDNKSGPGDTAERFVTTFVDNFTGWRELRFPWEVFVRGGWQPGGAPNDGLTLTEMWAYAIAPTSGSGTFYVDQVKLFKTSGPTVDHFQAGVPANWFVYGDWGAGAAYNVSTVLTNTLSAPGLVNNTVLRVDYTVAGWGCGGGRDLAPDDWSAYDGLSLWFYGSNTGKAYQIILSDNKSGPGDTAERFVTTFVDNFSGWRELRFPWGVFVRGGWQPVSYTHL
ncbi:MAG: hypothetical protein N2508_01210, partial [Anaerolineae bacterium]|nr:hypothetical protein [Anaerolineae bacterium]